MLHNHLPLDVPNKFTYAQVPIIRTRWSLSLTVSPLLVQMR